MSDPLQPGAEQQGASLGTRLLVSLIRFGRWLVRRRTPLVLLPMIAALIVAGSVGAQMLLEDIPEAEVLPPPAICWDNEEAATPEDCTLPTGTAGLRWVFPSFSPQKDDCRNLLDDGPQSPRPAEWACAKTLKNGVVVTVTYIQLADTQAGRIFFQKQFAGTDPVAVPDRDGNPFRLEWRQKTSDGFELAAVYEDFPFAVTVTSDNAAFRDKIFRSRVKMRQPKGVQVRKYPDIEPAEIAEDPASSI